MTPFAWVVLVITLHKGAFHAEAFRAGIAAAAALRIAGAGQQPHRPSEDDRRGLGYRRQLNHLRLDHDLNQHDNVVELKSRRGSGLSLLNKWHDHL